MSLSTVQSVTTNPNFERSVMRGRAASYDVFLSPRGGQASAEEALRVAAQGGWPQPLSSTAPAFPPNSEQHLGVCRALVALVSAQGFGEWQHQRLQF